ncbi:MAG: ankyrin repeat domain-containing protein, partial [Gammaproteobacteria bacterium]
MARLDYPVSEPPSTMRSAVGGILPAVVVVALTMAVCNAAQGNTLEDVRTAIKSRDYQRAARILTPIAERGVPEAQYQLAGLYRAGRGVEKDHEQAFYWVKEASLQDHVKAQYNLGVMYEHGWGTDVNLDNALKWYRAAAAQGHALAKTKIEDPNLGARTGTADPEQRAVRSRQLIDPQDALQRGAASGNLDVMDDAIAQGARVNRADGTGRTALMAAAQNGQSAALRMLLGQGAKHEHRDHYGDNALMIAVRADQEDCVAALLDASADPNIRDKAGNTPIIIAARVGNKRMVSELLNHGADLHATNLKGWNAVSLAKQKGHVPLVNT